jgi:hypothetical protein
MRPANYKLFIFLDVLTFGLGAGLTAYGIIDTGRDSEVAAGWGAFLVAIGFVIRHWTKILSNNGRVNPPGPDATEGASTTKGMAIGLAAIAALSLFGHVKAQAHKAQQSADGLEYRLRNVEYDVSSLQTYSHQH